MPIEAVVFDMDGVLIDSFEAWYATEKPIIEKLLNTEISKEEYKTKFFGIATPLLLASLGTPKDKILQMEEEHDKEFLKHLDKILIFPEAKVILNSLKENGMKLAVLSNNRKIVVDSTIGYFKLEKYFDVVMGIEIKPKPYPDGLLKILEVFKVDKTKAIYIGDTKVDEETGKNAGVKTVIVGKHIKTLLDLPGFIQWSEIRYF
ncbi:MAG TPA: HAD family hydrolase [archaeon]|nr:HAD family hydrolase [archaeon]